MAKKSHKRKPSKKHAAPAPAAEAEKIVSSRLNPDGTEVYRLRWKNREAADDAWRTRKQLEAVAGCAELLARFLELGEEGAARKVGFKETVLLKRTNAAGNSVTEEVELKG